MRARRSATVEMHVGRRVHHQKHQTDEVDDAKHDNDAERRRKEGRLVCESRCDDGGE